MAYRSAIVEDKILFFLSDTEIIELNTYDKIKKLIDASEDNKDQLLNEIKNGIIDSVNEELAIMEGIENPQLTKTMAYAKLMQAVSHYFFQEEKNRENEERRREHEEENGNWSWTGE